MNAKEFLERWINSNENDLKYHIKEVQTFRDVRQCLDAAFKTGISENDLDEASSGNLASYLSKARARA